MIYFNAHTHHPSRENELGLRNNFIQSFHSISDEKLQSSGIHPWHIQEVDIAACFDELTQVIHQIDAVGECGLDRVIDVDWEHQKEIFIRHIDLSEKHHLPLIIHSVRSYPDVLQIKKQQKCVQPWVIHGFTGNTQTADQLIKNGCYLSFGTQFMNGHKKTIQALLDVDPNYVFFETDDDAELSIKTVYKQASALLKVEEDELISQKLEIASKIFPKIKGLL
ncbi:hypothetical protein MY04_1972 [Flammeovirga sp. MY04]|uniref:TatD family hydrolase n=1 Tax=Flammeovirga sp. MY04 TaxID=1191459 RepID=UPI000806145B|nr:TatD family hydrolase [Flammeovirga sp. MY04]ANQ49346.1 hypothetical protein MY04_1972 [Flammeovirga sp. MY04]